MNINWKKVTAILGIAIPSIISTVLSEKMQDATIEKKVNEAVAKALANKQ